MFKSFYKYINKILALYIIVWYTYLRGNYVINRKGENILIILLHIQINIIASGFT